MGNDIKEKDIITIRPDKDLIASTAKEFRARLLSLVDKSPKKLVVDLSDVEMVDSQGISVLIAVHKAIEKNSGTLNITNASHNIFDLFNTMNLNLHFTVKKAD